MDQPAAGTKQHDVDVYMAADLSEMKLAGLDGVGVTLSMAKINSVLEKVWGQRLSNL